MFLEIAQCSLLAYNEKLRNLSSASVHRHTRYGLQINSGNDKSGKDLSRWACPFQGSAIPCRGVSKNERHGQPWPRLSIYRQMKWRITSDDGRRYERLDRRHATYSHRMTRNYRRKAEEVRHVRQMVLARPVQLALHAASSIDELLRNSRDRPNFFCQVLLQ
ncbi:hypothetical protein BJV78DRAFT_5517 [Lactifluus subvellereus]|nr:hypothetical protein BJV78DRAFT_5517 [Lactifluus subvellereus]